MCLILLGWQSHSAYPLVVAANRDEFYRRPSAAADYWPEAADVLAGRDLEAGGTWLGITRNRRFAAVTNVREPGAAPGEKSRGNLTREFLVGNQGTEAYLASIDPERYSGFNLLVSDGISLGYLSNRLPSGPTLLSPGVYGLCNRNLDTPWPKLVQAREAFAAAMDQPLEKEVFFNILADDQIAPDDKLPNTGVSLEWERRLSAIFVKSAEYGTRASTVAWMSPQGGFCFEERSFGAEGRAGPGVCFSSP